MNCESFPFIKQPLRYNQIVFITIKIIYNGMNKSSKESDCCLLVNNTFNTHVKVRSNFLSSVQFTYNNIAFVSHWDFRCPIYREFLHFIVHLSCNFAATSKNLFINFIFWWYQFNTLSSSSVFFVFLLT